jgi:type IV secretion system protein VirD4
MAQGAKAEEQNTHNPPTQPILGWNLGVEKTAIGFRKHDPGRRRPEEGPISDAGDGHLMTIAPTGAGKGRSVIIPTLLSYDGSVIVIDPKGENYEVTARRRREMGQAVFKLDPFRVTGNYSHTFNALDAFDPYAPDGYDQAMSMAELLMPRIRTSDPFWDDSARLLVAALLLHVSSHRPPVLKNLSEVAYLLHLSPEDLQFTIKEMLKGKNEIVRRMASGFSATEPKVWYSILSTAKAGTSMLNSICLAEISGRTDIPLDGIVRGDPISIYLVLPPDKLESHGRILRLWIGCLMDQICKRRHQVPKQTLFILDEAAQLGPLNQLKRAVTLLRGYGLRTWSFWQDLSQLQGLYPDWQTIFNNTRYVQSFGATTHLMAETIAHLLRLPGDIDPLLLPRDQLVLAESGRAPRVARKPDYLGDPQFKGLYDDNPFYQPAKQVEPRRFKYMSIEQLEEKLAKRDDKPAQSR